MVTDPRSSRTDCSMTLSRSAELIFTPGKEYIVIARSSGGRFHMAGKGITAHQCALALGGLHSLTQSGAK